MKIIIKFFVILMTTSQMSCGKEDLNSKESSDSTPSIHFLTQASDLIRITFRGFTGITFSYLYNKKEMTIQGFRKYKEDEVLKGCNAKVIEKLSLNSELSQELTTILSEYQYRDLTKKELAERINPTVVYERDSLQIDSYKSSNDFMQNQNQEGSYIVVKYINLNDFKKFIEKLPSKDALVYEMNVDKLDSFFNECST